VTLQSPKQQDAPAITVIVPVRNGRMHLSRCLEALSRSKYSNFEVLVVDDCSTDNTPEIAKHYGALGLRTPRTVGPGSARNLGAQHARGEILAFIDSDVVVPPETLGLLAEDFSRNPDIAAVFGSYDDTPAWPTFISQYKNLMHHYVHQISSESPVTFWAGCGAIRKSVFEQVGGFDGAQYPLPSIEDIALGLQLAQSGHRIFLDKRMQVKHLKHWTLRNLLRADIVYRAIPWSQLILKTRHLPRDLNLTYSSRVSSLAVGLLFLACCMLPLALSGVLRVPLLPLLATTSALVIMLLALNLPTYQFFRGKRGWWFAARAVLMHWLYYLYSGITFFTCALLHFARFPVAAARSTPTPKSEI
jgi:glycosyltransferase involved in cell wall biosynthesis